MSEGAGSGERHSTGRRLDAVLPLVERQHALIEHLRARAPRTTTAAELARQLGVTSRTVERDVARLVDAGLPISVRRGPGGGYTFAAPTRLPPVALTPAEAGALISAVVAVGPYISAAARSAMDKLLTAIGPDGS
ncbi:HTH domain-containing protein [Tamaricihabitans halophyticus]|uniref:HTH domain-containing protein n=1 Tax=Tamaricihabitans halophyticus TaxID=1262583 RepID=A0A4R2QM18_9PSEU|nr:HTH domain-containing protein [Tamaricihabitans halophyticus]TCP49919.1 HTH domain-containing protein [Tamaricihabitans halophyticus]